jgi:hypothetical protein
MSTEPQVIFNDSSMYAADIKWRDDIEPQPINDYEKDMIKHTKDANQLLKEESEERPPELTDDQKLKQKSRDYITRVKVLALDSIGKHPLANTYYFSKKEKQTLISTMEDIMKKSDDDIIYSFNTLCNDKLFTSDSDYSTFPVYNYLV